MFNKSKISFFWRDVAIFAAAPPRNFPLLGASSRTAMVHAQIVLAPPSPQTVQSLLCSLRSPEAAIVCLPKHLLGIHRSAAAAAAHFCQYLLRVARLPRLPSTSSADVANIADVRWPPFFPLFVLRSHCRQCTFFASFLASLYQLAVSAAVLATASSILVFCRRRSTWRAFAGRRLPHPPHLPVTI